MSVVTYSEARNNLKAVLDRAIDDHAPIIVARQRGKSCVIVSLELWEEMDTTAHLLSNPRNAQRLMNSLAQIEAGDVVVVDPETMQPAS